MGLFTSSRRAAPRIEPSLATPERRDAFDYGSGWGGLANVVGGAGSASPRLAENLACVVACVGAISGSLASLPATVYRTEGEGRVEVPSHPVARLLRAPNRRQTWPDWLEMTIAEVLLRGNALSVIERDGAGRPVSLTPVPWGCVSVQVLPSGRLAYDVVATATPYGGPAVSRRHLEGEVFHLKGRSDDGVVGRSVLSRAPSVLDAAAGLQEYSEAIWRNAATPSGALTLPANIKADGLKRIRAHFDERHVGGHNAKKVLFIEEGQQFIPFSVSPEDAEVLESRKFSVVELCRLFNVPPPIVQDYSNSTFTNASQASTWFATNTLTPWARKLEAEFSRSVFADPACHIEVDLSGLVRGDYATRWAANVAAVAAGILSVDEVRAAEGFGPAPKESTLPVPGLTAAGV